MGTTKGQKFTQKALQLQRSLEAVNCEQSTRFRGLETGEIFPLEADRGTTALAKLACRVGKCADTTTPFNEAVVHSGVLGSLTLLRGRHAVPNKVLQLMSDLEKPAAYLQILAENQCGRAGQDEEYRSIKLPDQACDLTFAPLSEKLSRISQVKKPGSALGRRKSASAASKAGSANLSMQCLDCKEVTHGLAARPASRGATLVLKVTCQHCIARCTTGSAP